MAKYLRDEFLKNITITEQTLTLIDEFLSEREETTNTELEADCAEANKKLLMTYIIRFDNRGYKLNDFSEVEKYYSQASNVERIIFLLDSAESERTNKMYGSSFEVRLDSNDTNNTYIQVASDDGDAVNSIFCGLKEILNKCHNKNGYVRNTWSNLLVQLFGVAVNFVISLIAAVEISPHIKIDNAFIIVFLFVFLIFSNAWGFINQQILRFLNYSFPNVRFSRKGKSTLHWLAQALVAGLIVAFTLLIISKISSWVGNIFGQYMTS